MSSLIIDNKEFVVILISFLGIVIPLWQYLNAKKKEQQQKNFENFHNKLLITLTGRGENMGIETQVAAVFELRNFSKYFSVTKRMLKDKKAELQNELQANPHFSRLINEIDETVKYIDKNFIIRFFVRIYERL